jgi:hypothetical protein
VPVGVHRECLPQSLAGGMGVPEGALDHRRVIEEGRVAGAEPECAAHRRGGFGVATRAVQRPGQQVPSIDVLPHRDLLLRLPEDVGDAPAVVQQKQAPGPVKRAGLAVHGDLEDAVVLRRLGGVAKRRVGIAHETERGRIQLPGDCPVAPLDRAGPVVSHRGEPGLRRQ